MQHYGSIERHTSNPNSNGELCWTNLGFPYLTLGRNVLLCLTFAFGVDKSVQSNQSHQEFGESLFRNS